MGIKNDQPPLETNPAINGITFLAISNAESVNQCSVQELYKNQESNNLVRVKATIIITTLIAGFLSN